MTRSKWITAAVALVVLATLGGWFWRRHKDSDVQYQTVAVTRGDLTQLVTATGQLNPVTNVTVGCQISGTLSKIYVDYNSPVTNGQIVAQIDPSTYQANLQLASADVANARASLELSQVNARRAKELFDSKLIPQSDYDTAIANLHQAEAALVNKQAALNRAQVDLNRCTIYSPVDGIVISRSVDVGQTVAASLNAPTLFTIANDLAKMQIDANVAEADVGGVEVGQNVDFTVDAFPNRTFHGEVVQVRNSPITVQNVVTYDTVIGVNNPDLKLKPGMTANVSIIIAERDDALKIPNAALRYHPPEAASSNPGGSRGQGGGGPRASGGGGGGNWGGKKRERSPTRPVYVLGKDGNPQQVQIKVGITDQVSTEVLEGLKEGDKVVTGSTAKQAGASQPQSPFGPGFRRF
ncbi:MAG TPA: efflux RND transporter periplasmic adaptor subunit [Verrucomicrobiae bacterium]|nr:efflux RND transporter periplasmic adaptor subunit [Verrucomicrobiae bacterium]